MQPVSALNGLPGAAAGSDATMLPLLLQALLEPLQRTGVLVRRTSAELRAQLPNFTVIERETKVRHGLWQRSDTAYGTQQKLFDSLCGRVCSCMHEGCLHI
jgi:hypothetical protein